MGFRAFKSPPSDSGRATILIDRTVRRIALPSGGWWELDSRPKWMHVREWAIAHGEVELVERALVSLTTAWSFCEPISRESLARRDAEDVIAAMELLQREVVPLWNGHSPRLLAEELFIGLMTGRIPDEFVETHVMALTGWSWETLQKTPAEVVERKSLYLTVKQAIEVDGALDFPEKRYDR